MAKRYLRSIVSPFQTLTASADITPVDLPVNPLSGLILTLQGTQVAETAAGLYSTRFDFLNAITALSVRHKGENIIQGSLLDLAIVNARVAGTHPSLVKARDTVAVVRSLSVPLWFTRVPYWHEEAFPATTRGNLQLGMAAGALPASFSAMSWQLEAIELIEDDPKSYLKYVTNARALTTTGQFDAPLPIGNPLLGILLFDPEPITTVGAVYSWGQVKLLVDNVEQYFPLSDWESLVSNMWQGKAQYDKLFDHRHSENLAAAYAQFANSGPDKYDLDDSPARWGWLDFDPLQDGSYALETAGHADIKLRGFADTGATAGTVRYLPVEHRSVK